jgi:hypothetical protein
MNRQSQWLFEAPFASETDHHTNPYTNSEYYRNSEWEAEWEVESLCPGASISTHKVRVLRVPFKKDFHDFLREVERAIGRWTVFRSDGGKRVRQLIERWKGNLRSIHQNNLNAGLRSGALIDIMVNFYYTGKGRSLRVCSIAIFVPEEIIIKG